MGTDTGSTGAVAYLAPFSLLAPHCPLCRPMQDGRCKAIPDSLPALYGFPLLYGIVIHSSLEWLPRIIGNVWQTSQEQPTYTARFSNNTVAGTDTCYFPRHIAHRHLYHAA